MRKLLQNIKQNMPLIVEPDDERRFGYKQCVGKFAINSGDAVWGGLTSQFCSEWIEIRRDELMEILESEALAAKLARLEAHVRSQIEGQVGRRAAYNADCALEYVDGEIHCRVLVSPDDVPHHMWARLNT